MIYFLHFKFEMSAKDIYDSDIPENNNKLSSSSLDTCFFYKKNFYKKVSLKNPETLRKCQENLQSRIAGAAIFKSYF